MIDSTDTKSGFQNVKSNQLFVRNLQRSDQHATFTCHASNNNISQPVSASTTIEIYCEYFFLYIFTGIKKCYDFDFEIKAIVNILLRSDSGN